MGGPRDLQRVVDPRIYTHHFRGTTASRIMNNLHHPSNKLFQLLHSNKLFCSPHRVRETFFSQTRTMNSDLWISSATHWPLWIIWTFAYLHLSVYISWHTLPHNCDILCLQLTFYTLSKLLSPPRHVATNIFYTKLNVAFYSWILIIIFSNYYSQYTYCWCM